jgi:hypothetical protein
MLGRRAGSGPDDPFTELTMSETIREEVRLTRFSHGAG